MSFLPPMIWGIYLVRFFLISLLLHFLALKVFTFYFSMATFHQTSYLLGSRLGPGTTFTLTDNISKKGKDGKKAGTSGPSSKKVEHPPSPSLDHSQSSSPNHQVASLEAGVGEGAEGNGSEGSGSERESEREERISISYPFESRMLGEEGSVELSLELNGEGKVQKIHLIKSSGYQRLDQAALEYFQNQIFFPQAKTLRKKILFQLEEKS